MTDLQAIETGRQRGFLRLLAGILISPRDTFVYLRENGGRAWLLAAIILLILSSLPLLIGGPIQAREMRQQVRQQMESQPGLPPEVDIEQVAAFSASPIVTTVIPTVTAVFGLLFSWLLWSGALYLLAAMTGGRGSFSQLLPVIVWATLPYGLRDIMQTIYIATTGSLIQNPGLSGFVQPTPTDGTMFTPPPPMEIAVLSNLLGQIELYLFWYLALLVIGLMAVMQLSQRKAIGLVVAVWAIFLLLRLLGTVISSSLVTGFA